MTDQPPPDEPGPLGRVYTLAEAAEYLQTKPMALSRAARRIGACSIFGRELRFSESDLLAIWDDARVRPTERRERGNANGRFLSEEKAFAKLKALVMKKQEEKRAARKADRPVPRRKPGGA